MYHSHHQYSQYLQLSATNQQAVAQTTKEFDQAGKLLPPQDEFTVLRDPVTFTTHITGGQPPAGNDRNNPGGSGSLGSGGGATLTSPTTGIAIPRSKPFCSAVKPAMPRSSSSSNMANNNNMDPNAPLMVLTPHEREVGRLSRSGRQLSELEILQEKHEAEFRRVVPVVSQALREVVAQHESLIRSGASRDDKYATYETNAVPSIKIDDYVQRIAEYTYISPTTLVASLIVLDRLSQRHPSLLFTMLNIYKLFFVGVRIASKVVDLRTLNNKNFASVGGISNRHLNEVEARMLVDLRFDLYISPSELLYYLQKGFAISTFIPRNIPHSASSAASLASLSGGMNPLAAVSSHPGSPIGQTGNTSSAPRSSSQRLGAGSRRGSNSNGGSGAAPTPTPSVGHPHQHSQLNLAGTTNSVNNLGNSNPVMLNSLANTTAAGGMMMNNSSNNPTGMSSTTTAGTSVSNSHTTSSASNYSNHNNGGGVAGVTGLVVARPPDSESPSNRPNVRRRPSSQV